MNKKHRNPQTPNAQQPTQAQPPFVMVQGAQVGQLQGQVSKLHDRVVELEAANAEYKLAVQQLSDDEQALHDELAELGHRHTKANGFAVRLMEERDALLAMTGPIDAAAVHKTNRNLFEQMMDMDFGATFRVAPGLLLGKWQGIARGILARRWPYMRLSALHATMQGAYTNGIRPFPTLSSAVVPIVTKVLRFSDLCETLRFEHFYGKYLDDPVGSELDDEPPPDVEDDDGE
jgi:hypothetical protein